MRKRKQKEKKRYGNETLPSKQWRDKQFTTKKHTFKDTMSRIVVIIRFLFLDFLFFSSCIQIGGVVSGGFF